MRAPLTSGGRDAARGDGRPVLRHDIDLQPGQGDAPDNRRDKEGARASPAFLRCLRPGRLRRGLFNWLVSQGVDFITYQRGDPRLPKSAFRRREARFEGERVRFMLAQDEVKVGRSGPWRRVVVRTKDGNQTPILTRLGHQVGMVRVAAFMFGRWREDNLFKYMDEHQRLHNLVSCDIGPADEALTVPNPAIKEIDRRLREACKALGLLKANLGDVVLAEPKDGDAPSTGSKLPREGK